MNPLGNIVTTLICIILVATGLFLVTYGAKAGGIELAWCAIGGTLAVVSILLFLSLDEPNNSSR